MRGAEPASDGPTPRRHPTTRNAMNSHAPICDNAERTTNNTSVQMRLLSPRRNTMHEATQISYGFGVVNIIMNSESTTEIPAPDIRFGDYKETLKSCFTQKELQEIEAEGEFYVTTGDGTKLLIQCTVLA